MTDEQRKQLELVGQIVQDVLAKYKVPINSWAEYMEMSIDMMKRIGQEVLGISDLEDTTAWL